MYVFRIVSLLFLTNCFLSVQAQSYKTGRGTDSTVVEKGIYRTVTYTYSEGTTREVRHYKQDRLNGTLSRYNVNGQLIQESTYKDGNLEGKQKLYDQSKHLIEESNYTYVEDLHQSRLNGSYKRYELDQCVLKATYQKGVPVDSWVEYYGNGKLKKEAHYVLLKPDSSVLDQAFILYERNGSVSVEGFYKKGKKEGTWKTYEDGNLTRLETYKNNKLHGIQKRFVNRQEINSGIFYEEIEVNGVFQKNVYDGTCIERFADGSLKKEEHYVMGIREGLFQEFYDNKQLKSSSSYKHNLLTGKQQQYDPNGQLTFETTYDIMYTDTGEVSVRHGTEMSWRNGKLDYEEQWRSGKRDGYCRYFNTNGTLLREQIFRNGLLDGVSKEYSYQGKLISLRTYRPLYDKGTYVKAITEGWTENYNNQGERTSAYYFHQDEWVVRLRYLHNKVCGIEIHGLLDFQRNPFGTPQYLTVKKKGYFNLLDLKWYSNQKLREFSFQDTSLPVSAHVMLSPDAEQHHVFYKIPVSQLKLPTEALIEHYQSYYSDVSKNNSFFVDTVFNGTYTISYADNKSMLFIQFEQNIPHGSWILFHPDTQDTIMQVHFDHGILVNKEEYKIAGKRPSASYDYYPNGKKKTEFIYSLQGLPYSYREFSEQGDISFYQQYTEQGKLQLQQGTKSDDIKEYFPNGKLRTSIKTMATDSSVKEIKTYYEQHGNEQQHYFTKHNQYDSTYLYYYPNGKLKFKANYRLGKFEGLYSEYDSSGLKRVEGVYTNGFAEGCWIYYKHPKNDTILFRNGNREVPILEGACACVDTSHPKKASSFMPLLHDVIAAQTILANCPNGWIPIDSLNYNRIFYNSLQFSNGGNSGFTSLNVVPLKELSFYYPASKEFKVCFNPGLVEGYYSMLPINASYDQAPGTHFNLNAEAKFVSIEFLKGPIQSTDKRFPHAKAIFKHAQITYQHNAKPEIQCDTLVCATPIQLLHHADITLSQAHFITHDLDKNRYSLMLRDIDVLYGMKQVLYGIISDSAQVSFPIGSGTNTQWIRNAHATVLLSGMYVAGGIRIPCDQLADDQFHYTLTPEGKNFSLQEMKMQWIKKGFTQVKAEFDSEKRAILLTFLAE